MKLRCLIIDDEPIARRGMQEFIQEVDFLQLASQAENATKAGAFLEAHAVDLVFLDIQMPKISGIEFLKSLSNPPMAIITTAFPDYAIQGFELDVVDYLVKPIAFDRFLKAVTKARDLFELKNRPPGDNSQSGYFFVKCDGRYERVLYKDLLYAEAYQNYCILHLPGKKLITYMTFGALEKQLSASQCMKVHKSYLVSLTKIDSLEGHNLRIGDITIPISRSLKEEVRQKLIANSLLRRK